MEDGSTVTSALRPLTGSPTAASASVLGPHGCDFIINPRV